MIVRGEQNKKSFYQSIKKIKEAFLETHYGKSLKQRYKSWTFLFVIRKAFIKALKKLRKLFLSYCRSDLLEIKDFGNLLKTHYGKSLKQRYKSWTFLFVIKKSTKMSS